MPIPTPEAITELRRERDRSMAVLLSANRQAVALEAALLDAERTAGSQSNEAVARIRQQLDNVRAEATGARADHRRLSDAAFAGLGQWLQQTPEQLVERLSDRDPFLLFPVRLETRFAKTAAGAVELRVRIWPDDISVALPAGDLTTAERQAGEQYWTARAANATTPPASAQADAVRRDYQGAWTAMATAYGSYRAGWIVRQTKPLNWDDQSNAPAALPLDFPVPGPPTEPRIARADVLPDRFVISGSFGDRVFPDVVGAPIPDDLALAPDPAQENPLVKRDAAGGLIVAEPLRWMVDFDAAVAVGMGVRIPLAPPWDTTGFDVLMAIGVRAATSPIESVQRVEALLSKHRYDTGCGILRSGTPTNNTDSAISGWQPPSTEAEQLFTIEEKPPAITPTPGPLGESDGYRLTRLLGLSEDFVKRLPNAAATDIAEALAMNRAASFATIFEFVKEFLNPLVDGPTRAALREFFHQYVSGRGVLPAIRVGRQPYGIVVTSDWKNWTVGLAPRGRVPIELELFDLMKTHRPVFQQLVANSPQTSQNAADPFQRLMLIVGQLASSAQYSSRVAVTFEYALEQLRMGGAPTADQVLWFNELVNKRRPTLDRVIPATLQFAAHLSDLLFTADTQNWGGSIIDRDPRVPLSERDPIAPFNAGRNYLDWLAHANLSDLKTEHFIGAAGTTIAPPAALLYVLLRYSLLTAVEEGTLQVAAVAGSPYFDVIPRDPLIANIGQVQSIVHKDYLTVDAAQLGLAAVATPLASWVHETSRISAIGSQFAAALAVVTDANDSIGALSGVPTARLERLLAEHIDLCSYRLDAWITALYSQRLEAMRSIQQEPGLYLGAYGWVENLRPDWNARRSIAVDALPATLRGAAKGPLFESTDNGGFIHTPSLPQACTAAVLRNAYMSHASPKERDLFSVNLSSARVRVAQTYIEGIRNNQSLAALLGYEFERGLHERHPGVELDQYIYVLRDRFPYMAGRLTDFAVGVNAEVVEARNVVNGLDLLEYTAGGTYPYALTGLPAAGGTEAGAIVAEIDRLRDGLDAVSDLLLAESVHQAVSGNMERTKASLQALTDPEAAPDPEVVRTPRAARLLTFRMTLTLDMADTAQWPGLLTPRAAANPALNAWLVHHLPPPADIQWSVKNGTAPLQSDSIAVLQIQPIDLVLLAGDQLGQLSSELERLIARRFRKDHNVDDDVRTRVAPLSGPPDDVPPLVFDFAASSAGKQSLANLHPLLIRLRRLISRSRAMHALDWLPSTELNRVDPTDPKGTSTGDPALVNNSELNGRLDDGATALKKAGNDLQAALAAIAPFQPQIDAVVGALFNAHPFGIPEALPADGKTISETQISTLSAQSQVVLGLIAKRLAAVDKLRAPIVDPLPATEPELTIETARRNTLALERATDAARELFGTAFVIVPLFHFHQPAQATELNLAATDPAIADAFEVEEWLQSVARVRPPIADVTWAATLSTWVGAPIADPIVIQLPRQAGAPWIGWGFSSPLPEGAWLAVVTWSSVANFSGLQCGLVLDEWTENVPSETTTTGVAFHFNRPNATAPQALLLAVPPVLQGNWTWAALKGSVSEALELAKLRSIEPDALMTGGYFQGLPTILTEFSVSRFAQMNLKERSAIAVQLIK